MADQVADSQLLRESISTRAPGIAPTSAYLPVASLAARASTARADLSPLAFAGPGAETNLEADFKASIPLAATEVDAEELNSWLEARVAELEVANRDLEAFSYTVAHDLRAPLRAIDGFAKILESEYSSELSNAALGHLGRVRDAAARMATLIRDLLEFSRAGQTELRRRPVALRPIVDRVVAALVAGSPERTVRVEIGDLAPCEGDEELLEQVLSNLLSNAWKFTVGEDAASVEVGTEVVAGITSYFVRDNGIGFSAGFAEKAFEAFQRVHSSNDFPGTGIGLASVKRIVLRHGGRVWAESPAGQGATFHFSLPSSPIAHATRIPSPDASISVTAFVMGG